MRLINGDKILMKLKQHRLLFFEDCGDFSSLSEKDKARVDEIDNCIAEVINASTIDPEDLRPKGRWISYLDGDSIMPERYYRCSRCGRTADKKEPYCHCGAKMKV